MKKVRKVHKNRLSKFFRKKCRLCADNIKNIDYKNIQELEKFASKKGKILPRRISGNCVKHQHRISRSIKRARYMALLPYIED